MQVEWEITMKCNYSCYYCSNLDKSIYPVLERPQIRDFIQMLGATYPGVEVFVFGGEPFVHPEIGYIIECFNEFAIPFVIQSNLSKYSIEVIKTIDQPFTLQASIHPTELAVEDIEEIFSHNIKCRIIDVMYSAKNALYYYFKTKELSGCDNVFLTPITDFGDGVSDTILTEFNKMKNDPQMRRLINFEDQVRLGKSRSELWADIGFSTLGKPCMYKDKYFLYGPNLELYNCCYRIKTDGICPKNKCFLM